MTYNLPLFLFFSKFFSILTGEFRNLMLYCYTTMKKIPKKQNKKSSEPKNKEPMSAGKKLMLKVALLVVILGTVLCALIFVGRYLYSAIYIGNPNYLLRNVEVISNGFWDDKDSFLTSKLGLKLRRVSIFAVDRAKVRRDVLEITGGKECEVRRILPDTIRINLIERVPRAKIPRYPQYLVDEDGIIMYRKFSMLPAAKLPIIAGVRSNFKLIPNKQTPELSNAMKIIITVLRYYSDIDIIGVNVANPEFLTFFVRYADGAKKTAVMPNSAEGIDLRLKALRAALIRSYNAKDSISVYNLSFDGKVVCR